MSCSRKSEFPTWLMRVVLLAHLLAGVFPWGNEQLAFAQIFKGSRLEPGSARPNSATTQGIQKNYFTVIGEVRYPQSYELPTASPSLVDLLRFASAGWPAPLSPKASGQIRIVRGGRVVQQMYYSDTLTVSLMPGDIVIADSKVGQGQMLHGNRIGSTPSPTGDTVHIALVGVFDYPFLMASPAKDTTLHRILQHLGQKPELAKSANIIQLRHSGPVGPDAELSDNTVIVFKPGAIDGSRLPQDIPRPFRAGVDQRIVMQPPAAPSVPDPVADAPVDQPGRAFVPGTRNGVGRTVIPELALDPSMNPGDGSVALDPETVDVPQSRTPSIDPANPEGRARVGNAKTEPKRFLPPGGSSSVTLKPALPEDVPSEGVAREALKPFASSEKDDVETDNDETGKGSSSVAELPLSPLPDRGPASLPDRRLSTVVPEPDFNSRINDSGSLAIQGSDRGQFPTLAKPLEAKPENDAGQSAVASPTDGSQKPKPDWGAVLLIVTASLGVGGTCWLLLLFVKAPEPKVQPADDRLEKVTRPLRRESELSAERLLDRLINNQIPLEHEPALFPQDLRIHGRPTNLPFQRVDAEHPTKIRRPHFEILRPETVAASSSANAPQREPAMSARQRAAASIADHQAQESRLGSEPLVRPSSLGASRPHYRIDAGSGSPADRAASTSTASSTAAASGTVKEVADDRSSTSAVAAPHVMSRPGSAGRVGGASVAGTTTGAGRSRSVNAASAVTSGAAHAGGVTQTVVPSRVITEGSDIVDRALAAFHQNASTKGQS